MSPSVVKAGSLKPLCRIVTPVGMLGYGFEEEELNNGLEISLSTGVPTAIILDSGSTDSGPAKLAFGSMTCPRESYERDLHKLVQAVQKYRVPLLIGSAGGDGSNAHVKEFMDIIGEILQSQDQETSKLKVIGIYSEVDRGVVLKKLEAGMISGCGPCVPLLTEEDVNATPTIVGQMGPEPFLQAMMAHLDVDIIIGGRAYDPAPYVAFCAFHALRRSPGPIMSLDRDILGGFTYMGKIMECGGLCALPKSRSAMATIYEDGIFDVRPLSPGSRCTPTSVAAHTMYEKTRPDLLHGPGGAINLNHTKYSTLSDDISIRVQGAIFESSKEAGGYYTIKLEGARVKGYRTIFMGSFGDPILIPQLPTLLDAVKVYVKQQHAHVIEKWELGFHIYGNKGMEVTDPSSTTVPREVFLVGEALAETQAVATSIASTARVACVHAPYKGQKATSGNFGMGIGGKLEIETGACAEFSLYHLMELDEGGEGAVGIDETGVDNDLNALFTWEVKWLGSGSTDRPSPPYIARHEEDLTEIIPSTKTNGIETPSITPRTLGEVAKVIRSKNAGPYEITLDVIFDDEAVYHHIKESGSLKPEVIAQLYSLPVEDLIWCGFFDQALAFKATLPRTRHGKPFASGSYMENDVHGSQQYLPLMNVILT